MRHWDTEMHLFLEQRSVHEIEMLLRKHHSAATRWRAIIRAVVSAGMRNPEVDARLSAAAKRKETRNRTHAKGSLGSTRARVGNFRGEEDSAGGWGQSSLPTGQRSEIMHQPFFLSPETCRKH